MLNALGGKVCFKDNGRNTSATLKNECVSYGSFTGDTEINRSGADDPGITAGPPAPPLPITNTVSIYRARITGQNSDFSVRTTPTPINIAGAEFTIPVASMITQGEAVFNGEKFSGNGRTCASCHVATDSLMMSPGNVQSRFATLGAPTLSFDPLFIGESMPSAFDAGFDFNLNTLVLTAEVDTPAPCTGELRGRITTRNAGRAKVLTRIDPTTYLVYGGFNAALTGTVTDGVCSATVASVTRGDLALRPDAPLAGIEDPNRMRNTADPTFPQGRALILENIDGLSNPAVFRRSPHLLNLSQTAPYGLSGEFPDLQTFSTGAVIQHFPRTLVRERDGSNPDFRLPTPEELDALEAYMLAQEFPPGDDPNKFDLAPFATTALQRRGREEFLNFGCASCHGGPTLGQTTISIQGKPVGVNASFNIGTSSPTLDRSLPCEPGTESVGACGTREFSTPQLFNLPNLGPYFHNGWARTLAEAVDFYRSSEFGRSPASRALIFQGVGIVPTDAITQFLAGLVARPYVLGDGPLRFGAQTLDSGPTEVLAVSVTNSSSSALRFDFSACRLEGMDPDDFAIMRCSLAPTLDAGESETILVAFDPNSDGPKSAILEIHPLGSVPSGIDLFGVGGQLGPPAELCGVNPVSGSSEGGESVTLDGTNFANGATVTVGGVRAGFVSVVSSSTIVAWTGAHLPGTADVVVINPDGQTTILRDAYTYVASPDL